VGKALVGSDFHHYLLFLLCLGGLIDLGAHLRFLGYPASFSLLSISTWTINLNLYHWPVVLPYHMYFYTMAWSTVLTCIRLFVGYSFSSCLYPTAAGCPLLATSEYEP
jgi:hypothetical protein